MAMVERSLGHLTDRWFGAIAQWFFALHELMISEGGQQLLYRTHDLLRCRCRCFWGDKQFWIQSPCNFPVSEATRHRSGSGRLAEKSQWSKHQLPKLQLRPLCIIGYHWPWYTTVGFTSKFRFDDGILPFPHISALSCAQALNNYGARRTQMAQQTHQKPTNWSDWDRTFCDNSAINLRNYFRFLSSSLLIRSLISWVSFWYCMPNTCAGWCLVPRLFRSVEYMPLPYTSTPMSQSQSGASSLMWSRRLLASLLAPAWSILGSMVQIAAWISVKVQRGKLAKFTNQKISKDIKRDLKKF